VETFIILQSIISIVAIRYRQLEGVASVLESIISPESHYQLDHGVTAVSRFAVFISVFLGLYGHTNEVQRLRLKIRTLSLN